MSAHRSIPAVNYVVSGLYRKYELLLQSKSIAFIETVIEQIYLAL